jgi:hypothetical protein
MYCTVLLYALRSTGRAVEQYYYYVLYCTALRSALYALLVLVRAVLLLCTVLYCSMLYALRSTGRAVEQYYYYVLYCTALRSTLYW